MWFVHRTWAPGWWASGDGNLFQVLDVLGSWCRWVLPSLHPPPQGVPSGLNKGTVCKSSLWHGAFSTGGSNFPLVAISLQMVTAAMKFKRLAPWKKSYDRPRQHIEKQRHYFVDKGPSSQGYGFSNVKYGWESWTIKKAEHWRMNAFELWCWRRLWRVPWTARRSNLSILKEINPEYSLEALMLKLKLQYFGHLMWRVNSLEKTLMLGKTEGRRRRGQASPTHEFGQTPGDGEGQGSLVSGAQSSVMFNFLQSCEL